MYRPFFRRSRADRHDFSFVAIGENLHLYRPGGFGGAISTSRSVADHFAGSI